MSTRREEIIEEQFAKQLLVELKKFESFDCNCKVCSFLKKSGFFNDD